MEYKQIKELMGVMGRTGTKRLVIEEEGYKLELERHDNSRAVPVAYPMNEMAEEFVLRHDQAHPQMHARHSIAHSRANEIYPMTQAQPHKEPHKENVQEVNAGVYVTSPMVGTYYASPSPEDPHFVKIGDKVEKHTVVCIIEAMKVMNEVKSGVTGTVAEVLVENGQPVEFGTKLFRIT